MDTLITVAIVLAAALWGVSRVFRRPPPKESRGGCASGCEGCPLAGHGAHGAEGGCGAVPARSPRGAPAPDRSPRAAGR